MSSKRVIYENLDVQEQMEREKKHHNVIINGVEKEENENTRSLKGKTQVFKEHFDMTDLQIEGAHRARKKKEDNKCPKIIVCTIMNVTKRQIILDNSSIYLKGTNMYINEDHTFMQQEKVRKRVVERKAKLEKKSSKPKEKNDHA